MFYGQIMMQKYLKEPSISFCAIGDYSSDDAPLQITDFGVGKEIDQLISKMYLEGGGGGNGIENYELSAYFYLNHSQLKNTEMPFFFLTGDEGFYDKIPINVVKQIIGSDIQNEELSNDVWKGIMKKFNFFFVKKEYSDEKRVRKQWIEAVTEERILYIQNPKAVIDVILGAIALTTGKRTLEGYINDMKERGQDDSRIEEVVKALSPYYLKLLTKQVTIIGKIETEVSSDDKLTIKEQFDKICFSDVDDEKVAFIKNLKLMNEKFGDSVPEEFICPLTKEIMIDPVMTYDGHTFDKIAIELWFQSNDSSPVTHYKLDNKNLIPNSSLKNLIKSFYNTNVSNL